MSRSLPLRSGFSAALATGTLLGAVLVLPALVCGTAGASSGSICQKVTPADISAALGIKATKVSTVVNGSVTVCWYKVGMNPEGAFVRVQTGDNIAGYKSDMKSAKTYSENPKADTFFSPLPAFSTVIGSATYGYTYSVTVLKKTTELDVGGATSTLAKVQTFVKGLLSLM